MDIINTKEVANIVKSDKRTIERRARAGYYPQGVCGRHGRYWLFNKEKLLEFIFSPMNDVKGGC